MRVVHSSPVRSTALFATSYCELQVGLAALAAEDVRRLTRVELRLQHIEVLVGGDDLVVDVDAGLSLELLGELHLGGLDPVLGSPSR